MRYQPTGHLMIQADFGRTALNRPALLLASHYRLMVAILVSGLILFQFPFTSQPLLLLVALLVYLVYALVRFRLPQHLEDRFYTPRIQFWRAQLGIIGVTALLLFLGQYGTIGSLWILYLPALLLVSRYCEHQRTYGAVAIEVACLAALTYLLELQRTPLPPDQLVSLLIGRMFAVLLPSFLVHYLARVDITAKRGSVVRDQIVHMLLERVLLETDPLALWWAIRDACATAVNATASELYLYEHEQQLLRRVEPASQGYALGRALPLAEAHPAAQAARERKATRLLADRRPIGLAVPILGQPDHDGNPLAVVVVRFHAANQNERRAVRLFLADLLQHIWPICTYASIRQQAPLLDQIDDGELHHSLRLDQVLDVVLETLCHKLGFSFATISLVNEDQQEIRTVRGKNVPEDWVAEAHHPLDSHDIQADVLRTGRVEVIGDFDPRFDERIWSRYNHADLVRVWVPLGRLGTIEAGFYKRERPSIPPLLIEVLKRYVRDVTIAIQNAQLYESEQNHAALLARLHEVSCDLQTYPQQHEEFQLLEQIAQAALDVLRADLVMFYPLNRRDGRFAQPIHAGEIVGPQPLAQPEAPNNIVLHIAETCQPYYQPDAQCDPLLAGDDLEGDGAGRRSSGGHRTFTIRQNIYSFAGVPLLAQGELLGVLCVNYRERHQFSPHDQQVIGLFAQQAAAVIASGQLVREQERRRIENDLHDSVKSGVRGLILLSHAATEAVESDACLARKHLHEVRRAAWGILADVDMILKDLTPTASDGQALPVFIREELRRLAGREVSKLSLDLDEYLPALPMPLTRTLLYLMREAVINALEHAEASTIHVGVHCTDDRVQLMVSDDGRGFDPDPIDGDDYCGLAIMRERAIIIGGNLEIHSALGAGTTVWGDLPRKEEIHGAV